MTATELADHLAAYARSFAAPVHEESAVRAVERAGDGFAVRTDDETWFGRERRAGHRLVRPAPRAGAGRPPSTAAWPR